MKSTADRKSSWRPIRDITTEGDRQLCSDRPCSPAQDRRPEIPLHHLRPLPGYQNPGPLGLVAFFVKGRRLQRENLEVRFNGGHDVRGAAAWRAVIARRTIGGPDQTVPEPS